MATEKKMIEYERFRGVLERYINAPHVNLRNNYAKGMRLAAETCLELLDAQPIVDAVTLPKGKPGDYLEWDNGAGFRQIYRICSVMICEDCMRYDIEICSPVVNHPNIVRVMSLEEAEKEWHEMCEKAQPKEEPTLTACAERMEGDDNKKA